VEDINMTALGAIDIGLRTNRIDEVRDFWAKEIGLPFDSVMQLRPEQAQHRYTLADSVLKINHNTAPLPDLPKAGYREVIIARPGIGAPKHLKDPEGVDVTLAPPGYLGVQQVGVRMVVRDLERHRAFFGEGLGLKEISTGVYEYGPSLLIIEQGEAGDDSQMVAPGFRYITFIVSDALTLYARLLEKGGTEAIAPVKLDAPNVTYLAMIRDPDGNTVELIQRP
jgi:catechol 2,3-dioxygenase-like lactoylglutathione lyase family enzyme